MALPFMKNVVLPVMKDEAGQLIQDVTSGKEIKRSLEGSSKRVGKRIITKALTGRGRVAGRKNKTKRTPIRHHSTRKRRTANKTAQQLRKRKGRVVEEKWESSYLAIIMSSTLSYVDCPMHQLDICNLAGIQTQVLGHGDVKYLPISIIQDNASITFQRSASPHYMDLSKIYFKTVVEIVGPNEACLKGTSFTDDSDTSKLKKVGLINYLAQT